MQPLGSNEGVVGRARIKLLLGTILKGQGILSMVSYGDYKETRCEYR